MSTFTDKQKEKAPWMVKTVVDCTILNPKSGTDSIYSVEAYNLTLNRPANVSNPPDASGWRKPSNFYTRPGSSGPYLFGLLRKQRVAYNPRSKNRRDVILNSAILGSNGVQTNFRSLPGVIPPLWNMPMAEIWSRITWEMEQAVRVQAIASLASRKGKILETFAELRSSVGGLAANAEEISWFIDNHRDRDALRKKFNLPRKHPALKRMRRIAQTAKGSAEFFGKQWLNFWFGLSPIVSEMVFVTLILSNPENFRRLRVKGTGHRWVDEVITASRNRPGVSGSVRLPYPAFSCNITVPLRVGIRLSAYYQVKSEAIAGLKQYGIIDVASTAWAVAPLSWMVDWVIPVTKLLESYEGLAGLSYKGATVTKYYVFGEPELDGQWKPGLLWDAETAFKADPVLLGGKGFERQIVLPMGMLPAPYIKDPLNLWTATTALSFMAQKLKRVLNFRP